MIAYQPPNLRFPLPSLTYLHMEIGEGGGDGGERDGVGKKGAANFVGWGAPTLLVKKEGAANFVGWGGKGGAG